jgi:muconolactone delta-isomerase
MRYLVVTKQTTPMPPEMVPALFAAMKAFSARYTASGKIEQSWSFAGLSGGGAILDVASPEELDEIMAEFPLGPFSQIEIYGLVHLDKSLDAAAKAFEATMGGMAKH